MNDLVLKGGRVIDPSQGMDRVTDIAFAGGKVAAIGDGLLGSDTRDVTGKIVSPGLIDLHTHVYWGGTSLGVEAELLARSGGVTTFIDAGSAGPGNFHGFRKHVIETSPVRILPYLNVSFPGIFAFSKSVMVGESADMRLLDAREAVRVAREHRDLVLGVKVRVGKSASGDSGIMPLDIALDVAEEAGLPMMAHLDSPPPSRQEVVSRLRPGDILTHCFRPFPNAPVQPDGKVRDEILAARARGVIFDIGHGGGSFGFGTTRKMLAAGFLPDVISSDVHAISIEGPAFDLLTTMSKFLCLGLDLATVIKLATVNAAAAIKRPDLGTLKVGSVGEATVIDQASGAFDYADSIGEKLIGDKRLLSAGVVLAGRWWHPL
ncbi:amidohydrolase/deacetylase family metallohydrolase [Reyranella sp.]|jgi:dihydroorotase|uniref:amidohydrolase/deacetylase family metallohydrolase n=1 Tax=Reyranella sp. TaxID=1929291 RepID=UPI000BC99190|nr:amidohydrolase/deacetylase family metallohydrolase [Reyranella sp.]OYY43692.1 MAG: dihydroorotase [Rhodospirillales bacterium 35-66-84]OYZ94520.1 MAG: dihydroorotase [Rhodospirillales bacterium 24-66-33]OZB25584.1 MAG: dihydroorotase [Rhodospirillales bacterium 39-66-50]HQS16749.1 amidohydrolase/deacetylase family metallohydrolase [Reyranella sp.]HQT13503.1 amidohydrolase/deacetylase family metallohydrolase [Reyranella sp.]